MRARTLSRAAACLLAASLTLICAPTPTPANAFFDTGGNWAEEVIQKAAQYGLMEGYPDGRFGVGDNMTRAQFVTVLCRMFRWEDTPTGQTYIDVSPTDWYYTAVETAAAHDVSDPGGAFRPEDYISRAEMAEMLVRALGYSRLAGSLDDAHLPFPDVTEDRGYIAIAYDLGIITGVEENGSLRFLPTFSAPREQAAAMLVRCYERYTASTDWFHGFYATSSFSQLSYTDEMDAVSVGWGRLEADDTTVTVNQTSANGNGWVRPSGSELVTDRLSERSIPCNLSVFATAATFSAVTASGNEDAAIAALTEAAAPYSGLTIDFEGLTTAQRAEFTAFMTALRAALPADQTLYVCVQPDTWYGGYDYRALSLACDKVILMAHDYQWPSIPDSYVGTANTYSPVTPFDQVYAALQSVTHPETGVADKSKLALAISFNTAGFHVDENGLLADQTIYHPAPETISRRLAQPDCLYTWDAASHNPSITYANEEGERYKLWYEDEQSVADKLQLARMFGVNGVSVWRLGIIPNFDNYDVWNVLKQS